MDETLELFVRHVEDVRWAALLLDDDWRLQWVSSELKEFLGEHDDERLGRGRHVAEAFLSPPWLGVSIRRASPPSCRTWRRSWLSASATTAAISLRRSPSSSSRC